MQTSSCTNHMKQDTYHASAIHINEARNNNTLLGVDGQYIVWHQTMYSLASKNVFLGIEEYFVSHRGIHPMKRRQICLETLPQTTHGHHTC